MQKSRNLAVMLSIQNTCEKKVKVHFDIQSPLAEAIRKSRSQDQSLRKIAYGQLSEIVKNKNEKIDAIEAIRLLGKSARDNDEDAQFALRSLGNDAWQRAMRTSAIPNKAIELSATVTITGLTALSYALHSPSLALISLAVLFSTSIYSIYRSQFQKPLVNILKMSEKSAFKILKGINNDQNKPINNP